MYVTDLAEALRAGGQKVVEHSGWTTRGHGHMSAVRGFIWHHTASPASSGSKGPISVVRDGRAGLLGPLAQLALDRDGTWHVLAAGVSWHAGAGSYGSFKGNSDLIGVECLNAGTAAEWPWPEAQVKAAREGFAALCRHYGLSASTVIGHKEWAKGRKIDPYGFDMAKERERIAALIKTPTPPEEDEMKPEDFKKIREIVQDEVEKGLRTTPYHGKSLAEWWRGAFNLSESNQKMLKRLTRE